MLYMKDSLSLMKAVKSILGEQTIWKLVNHSQVKLEKKD